MLLRLLWLLLMLLTASIARAQSAPVCAPPVLLSLARAGSACYNAGNNEACFGGGAVSTEIYEGGRALVQPGDRADVNGLQRVIVGETDEGVSAAFLNVQADLPDADQKRITLLVFGAAEVENLVPPTPRQILTALGTVNIRVRPALQTEIVARINIGQTLTANGITADGKWLRVAIPNTDRLGWVGVEVVSSSGAPRDLNVVTPETILNRAFEIMTIETSPDFTACDGALSAGVLAQSPNIEKPVTMNLNGRTLKLAGTALIQGSVSETKISILEGEAIIDGVYIPAGAQFNGGTAQPIETVSAALPLNNLRRRFSMPDALTVEAIGELTAAYEARANPPVAAVTLGPDTTCRRTTREAVTLWAGPGSFYEVINEQAAGRPINPVIAITDADGEIWWQLNNNNWIRARLVSETGQCQAVPISNQFAPPRNNTLSLETCRTTNGPLRQGQSVRIEFRPQPFDNLGEARDALKIDPGRIIIGTQRFRASATDPIKLGTADDRYIRTFYISWIATPGTFRIEGDRLTYEPICTITVPAG